MDLDEPIPEHVKHRELDAAEFVGPTESVELTNTGIDSSYSNFGFTMHRARFDDWLRERAENAGAEYRVGTGVAGIETDLGGAPSHTLTLRDGTEIEADYLVLADGPQRTITGRVLERWLPEASMERLDARRTNHIAYQEYRELPEELFEDDRIKFWWGYMPGHTAYPWVFPNDGRVARVGLTMPIDLDLETIENRESYRLLRPEDERIPQGGTYIERLLETAYPEYDLEDFPIQETAERRAARRRTPSPRPDRSSRRRGRTSPWSAGRWERPPRSTRAATTSRSGRGRSPAASPPSARSGRTTPSGTGRSVRRSAGTASSRRWSGGTNPTIGTTCSAS